MTYRNCLFFTVGTFTLERYDNRRNEWYVEGKMGGRRLQFGVAVVGGRIFVVGGRDGLKTLNTVECYDPETKRWSSMTPMSTHRHGLGIHHHFYSMYHIHTDMDFSFGKNGRIRIFMV